MNIAINFSVFVGFFFGVALIFWILFKNSIQSFRAEMKADIVTSSTTDYTIDSVINIKGLRVENALILEAPFTKTFYTTAQPDIPFREVEDLGNSYCTLIPFTIFSDTKKVEQLAAEKLIDRVLVTVFVKGVRNDDVVKVTIIPKSVYEEEIVGFIEYKTYVKLNPQEKMIYRIGNIFS